MGAEQSGPNSATSSKEVAFWCKFIQTQPKPPETLERQQVRFAEQFLNIRANLEDLRQRAQDYHLGADATTKSLERAAVTERNRLITKLGYPEEAVSDDAVFWAYVLNQRQQYETLQSLKTPNSVRVQSFFRDLLVDRKLVTEPLTGEQVQVANLWKIAYLQRLRRERTDESYIDAYLKAWNLTPAQVFGEQNK